MNKPGSRFLVGVKSNNDFTFIETYSGYWDFLPDPEGKKLLMLPSASDAEIGSAILEAISVSRQVDPKSAPGFFDIMGKVVPQYAEWVSSLMEKFGYKTRRAMFKEMKNCSVELVDGINGDATQSSRKT